MIYFIRSIDSDFVKIGYTKDNNSLNKRLKSLKTSCPYKLVIEGKMNGSKLKERYIHSICIDKHESGEWFRLTSDEVKMIIEEYHKWSPTKNGIDKMPAMFSVKKKRYFK